MKPERPTGVQGGMLHRSLPRTRPGRGGPRAAWSALLLGLAVAPSAAAADAWQRLVFEGGAWVGEARSEVERVSHPAQGVAARLSASGRDDELAPVSERVDEVRVRTRVDPKIGGAFRLEDLVWLDAGGAVLERVRLRRDGDPSHKLYRYAEGAVVRLRRKPADGEGDGDPARWSEQKRSVYAHPPGAAEACPSVSDPTLLLLRGPELARAQAPPPCLFNKKVLLRVELSAQPDRLEVDYVDAASGQRVRGRRDTLRVVARGLPVRAGGETEPLSLLGLEGELTLHFDAQTGLPLAVAGQAPGLPARLQVTLRERGSATP